MSHTHHVYPVFVSDVFTLVCCVDDLYETSFCTVFPPPLPLIGITGTPSIGTCIHRDIISWVNGSGSTGLWVDLSRPARSIGVKLRLRRWPQCFLSDRSDMPWKLSQIVDSEHYNHLPRMLNAPGFDCFKCLTFAFEAHQVGLSRALHNARLYRV